MSKFQSFWSNADLDVHGSFESADGAAGTPITNLVIDMPFRKTYAHTHTHTNETSARSSRQKMLGMDNLRRQSALSCYSSEGITESVSGSDCQSGQKQQRPASRVHPTRGSKLAAIFGSTQHEMRSSGAGYCTLRASFFDRSEIGNDCLFARYHHTGKSCLFSESTSPIPEVVFIMDIRVSTLARLPAPFTISKLVAIISRCTCFCLASPHSSLVF